MTRRLYMRLAADRVPGAARLLRSVDWNPDQPRDPDGKFGEGGGSGGLSQREHELMQAMLTERSDRKVLQKVGMAHGEAMSALTSIRQKLGISPLQSLRSAYKEKFNAKA